MITIIELEFPPDYQPRGPQSRTLRGAICEIDPGNPLLCQRDSDGKFLYRYPQVQYRWDINRHRGILVGFLEGSDYLLNMRLTGRTLRLGEDEVPIIGTQINTTLLEFSQSDTLRRYRFLSPWSPLDGDSFAKYSRMSKDDRAKLLDQRARNHLVSAMRDLGCHPDWQVTASVHVEETAPCRYKESTSLMGVWGTLVCNVNLPEGFAFGRKVSYGFGWIGVNGG